MAETDLCSRTDRVDKLLSIDWDFPEANRKEDIHSIHPYPARFIPEIPRTFLEELGIPEGTAVLDPFCGAGATLCEAQRMGYPAIGIDLNPIACLISKVKTTPLPDSFIKNADRVARNARLPKATTCPDIPNLDHWFMKHVQRCLCGLIGEIDEIYDENVRDALRLALSSIMVRVSNQESDTRYAAIEKNVTEQDVFDGFSNACQRLEKVMRRLKHDAEVNIINANTLEVCPTRIHKPVGIVITSPPYPNAYEYWLYHKYRMWWLGYDPIEVKSNEIGARAHFFKKNHHTPEDFQVQMSKTLEVVEKVLVEGGYVCVVVGRSKIHGKIIDNASIVKEAAAIQGMTLVAETLRRIAAHRKSFNLSHASIKNETILVFVK